MLSLAFFFLAGLPTVSGLAEMGCRGEGTGCRGKGAGGGWDYKQARPDMSIGDDSWTRSRQKGLSVY